MNKIYEWEIRRAGAGMTITHSTGKITNVDRVKTIRGLIVARASSGLQYELVLV